MFLKLVRFEVTLHLITNVIILIFKRMKQLDYLIRFFILSLLLGFIQLTNAQNTIYLKLKSHTTRGISISNIDKITFSSGNMVFDYLDSTNETIAISAVSKLSFNSATAIEELASRSEKFILFPNPVSSKFYIKGLKNIESVILIYSLSGTLVYRSTIVDTDNSVDVSNLRAGLYLLKIDNQTIKFSKL